MAGILTYRGVKEFAFYWDGKAMYKAQKAC
jgi:hypothetical protein